MPIVLLIVGAVFLISAIRGTHKELGTLALSQFSGAQSFMPIMFAVILIGMIGTIEALKPLARAFLVLFLITLFLLQSRNGNVFDLLGAQLFGRSLVRSSNLGNVVP